MDSSLKEIRNYLMNELYGIDPEVPSSLRDINYLTELFGLHRGRFIASFPFDWENIILNNLSNLPDLERAKVVNKLKKLMDATLPIDAEYRRTKKWVENIFELQTQKRCLSNVYSTPANPYEYPSLVDVLQGEEDLPDGIGDFIPMTVKSYRAVVRPLFLKSSEVHFIDKFFNLRKDANRDTFRWKVLQGLFEEAKISKRCNSFCFHLHISMFPTEQTQNIFLEDAREVANEIGFKDLDISYTLDSKQHGRYIFSVKGGLKFDQGFETFSDPSKTNDIQWLSPKLLNKLLDEYDRGYV